MDDTGGQFIATLARALTPILRYIQPAYMKFLIVLAVLLAGYFFYGCQEAPLGKIVFALIIGVIALLGCGMQVYQWRLAAQQKLLDSFAVALRDEVKKNKAVGRGRKATKLNI
jgi:hypothetical protein